MHHLTQSGGQLNDSRRGSSIEILLKEVLVKREATKGGKGVEDEVGALHQVLLVLLKPKRIVYLTLNDNFRNI